MPCKCVGFCDDAEGRRKKYLQCEQKCGKVLVREGDRVVCPICGRRTSVRLLETTRLRDFPLYCKNCRNTTIVNTEPEPMSLSR